MAESDSANASGQDPAGQLIALMLRSFDGLMTPDDVAQLEQALSSSSAWRDLFVQLCRMHGLLNETLAPQSVPTKSPSRKQRQEAVQSGAGGGGQRPAVQERRAPAPERLVEGHGSVKPGVEVGEETLTNHRTGEDTVHTNLAKLEQPE